MVYLDNAATMYPRPDCVAEAVAWALAHTGSPGRSAHEAAFAADQVLNDARAALASFLNAPFPERIIFAQNATDALNMALFGFLPPMSHVVTTMMEHNSVLRPLYRLQKTRRIDLSVVPPDADGVVRAERIEKALTARTSLVVMTHVSNVTGCIMPVEEVGALCRKKGVAFLVDGAQAAGHIPVDIENIGADLYAFPGHKGLCGPQGTGGLYVAPQLTLTPLKSGGTGVMTFSHDMPEDYPEHLEAGTQNVHGISGLLAGVRFVSQRSIKRIHMHERALSDQLIDALCRMPDCVVYAPRDREKRSGVVSFNMGTRDSSYIANALAARGICVRAGFHCAPLAHEVMRTKKQGAIRVGFSLFNTQQDVETLIESLLQISRNTQ